MADTRLCGEEREDAQTLRRAKQCKEDPDTGWGDEQVHRLRPLRGEKEREQALNGKIRKMGLLDSRRTLNCYNGLIHIYIKYKEKR